MKSRIRKGSEQMDWKKRAGAYLIRKKIRTGILFFIMVLISSAVLAVLSMQESTGKVEEKLLSLSNSGFQVESILNDGGIQKKQLTQIEKTDGVKDVQYEYDAVWRNSFVTNLNTPFMIGNVEIPNRTVLAPMAGVTNSAFRTIAKELGAGLVVMEMVSDKGIQYNNEKTLHMLHIDEGENPVSIQLFGSDEDSLARAAEFIQENTKTDIVDINMGCPVNKIVKNEAWLHQMYHEGSEERGHGIHGLQFFLL